MTTFPSELSLTMRRGLKFFKEYGDLLRKELDEYTEGTMTRHRITLQVWQDVATCTVTFVGTEEGPGPWPTTILEPTDRPLGAALGFEIISPNAIRITHPLEIENWTNVQAWKDSNDFIGLMLLQHAMSSRETRL